MSDPRAGHEAARLLAAAQDWLRTSAPHLAPVADDGQPCSCPVCRAVAGLREADPESVGRWVDSAVTTLGALVAQAGDLAAKVATSDEPDEDEADEDEADASTAAASDGDGDPEVDETSPGERPPDDGDARQDGASSRRVRRIPLQQGDGTGEQGG